MRLEQTNIPDKLWTVSNLIVGFAAAQTMTFVFAIGDSGFAKLVSAGKVPLIIASCTAVFAVSYIAAVVWCHCHSVKWYQDVGLNGADLEKYRRFSRLVTVGRIFGLIAFAVLAALPAFFIDGKPG